MGRPHPLRTYEQTYRSHMQQRRSAEMAAAAPWKQLLVNALESNSKLNHSSFFQLATVGADGRPSNRTVVFRGFQEGSDRIQINTNRRSGKIEDIKHNPCCEICWYFTESWEQFRINGEVDVVDWLNPDPAKLEQREKAWFASSLKSRLQFLGPRTGLPCVYEDMCKDSVLDSYVGPVDAFCLLVVDPEKVDYLNLKNNKRLMFVSKVGDDGARLWTQEEINP